MLGLEIGGLLGHGGFKDSIKVCNSKLCKQPDLLDPTSFIYPMFQDVSSIKGLGKLLANSNHSPT